MGRRWGGVFTGLLPVAAALLATFPLHNNDLWWHLAAGKWIWQHHAIPRDDIFSWTHFLGAWVDNEWLWELLTYVVWQIGGNVALIVVRALVFASLVLLLRGYVCALRVPRAYVPASVAAITLSHFWWELRPSVASIAGLLIMLIVVEHARNGRDRLWSLPLLFLVWANVHPGFAFGLVVLACIAIACALDPLLRRLRRSSRGALTFPRIAAVTLVSALATLINPYGIRVYEQQLVIARNPLYRQLLDEWMSPPAWISVTAVLVIAVALFSMRRIPLMRLAPLFGTALLSMTAIRFAEYLAWIAVPLVLTVIPRLRLPAGRLHPLTAVAAALVVVVVAYRGETVEPHRYPTSCAAAIPPGARLFNRLSWGGWLIWNYDRASFIDGRCSGQRLFFGYLLAENGAAAKLFDGWRIDAVLVSRDEGVGRQLVHEPGWRVACADDASLLLRRAGIPAQDAPLNPVRRR